MRYIKSWAKLNKTTEEKLSRAKTPFILYDLDKLKQNYQQLSSLWEDVYIHYAVKANRNTPILEILNELGAGFEVNSRVELDQVLKTGASTNKIINSSPVKKIEDIKYFYKKGIDRFAFDCKDEIDKLSTYAPGSNVYLRVHTSNHGSGQRLNTKTGIPLDEAETLLSMAIEAGLNPFGITFTVGSQCNNLDNWKEGIAKTAYLFATFPTLDTINVGGGIPIEYSEKIIQPKDIVNTIRKNIDGNFKRVPKIILEPGRYLAGSIALTATSIIGVRELKYVKWLFVDTSVFGAFLELLEFKSSSLDYPVVTDETEVTEKNIVYQIAGLTCDGMDIIKRNATLPKLSRGDKLYFLNTGAYTLEYASAFNGIPIPKSYFIKDGELL